MTNTNDSHRFQVLEVALELVREAAPLVQRIKRVDADLADQVKRALTSVTSNIGEGNRRRGRDRAYRFRIAAGSADEAQVQLRTAEAWGYLALADIERAVGLADRVLAMLYRLT
jgi:four helix bundle protein